MSALPVATRGRSDRCAPGGLRSSNVSDDRPFAELPDEISLTRDELAVILFALDVVEEADVDPAEAAKVRRAIRLLTAKLWPELGDLLGDDDQQ